MKSIIFASLFVVSIGNLHAHDKSLKICLTGSTEKAIPKYGEAFVNGAKLAINETPDLLRKKIHLETYFHESNPLAPVAALNQMIREQCDAIIGFSTGNDLLLIEGQLKKSPILTMSIYGDPQEGFHQTNYLRTIQPSAEDLVTNLMEKTPVSINEKSKILIVTAVDRSEMVEYRKSFEKALIKKSNLITHATVIEQTHDLKNLPSVIKSNKWDIIVLLTRSLIAAKITDIAKSVEMNKSTIYLGTKYFGSSELPAYHGYLKDKNIQAYFSRQNCSCDETVEYRNFHKKYIEMYGTDPMSISSDSYDLTSFIAKAASLKKINRHEVIKYLNNVESYHPLTTLKIEKGLVLSSKKRFLIKITKNGYTQVI